MNPFDGRVEAVALSAADLGITAAAGWTIASCEAVPVGPLRHLRVTFTYSGSTLTGSSSGNVADTDLFGTVLPVGWRPSGTVPFVFDLGSGGTSFGQGAVSAAGQATIKTLHANGTISSGNAVTVAVTYLAT